MNLHPKIRDIDDTILGYRHAIWAIACCLVLFYFSGAMTLLHFNLYPKRWIPTEAGP